MAFGELLASTKQKIAGKKKGLDRNSFPIFDSEILRHAGHGMSAFNEIRNAERTNIFNVSSVFPLSLLNDVVTGTVTQETDEYKVASGSILETAEIGRYVPGYQVESGKGIRIDGTTDKARWGYFDGQDGMWWRYDTSAEETFSLGVRRAGTDIRIASQSEWNIDRLDGNGPSGIDINESFTGLVFQEMIGWYGYIALSWWVTDSRSGVLPQTWPVHVAGDWDRTSIENPNLPIRIENDGASGNIYCGGRQFSIIGRFVPSSRITAAHSPDKVTLGTDWTPIVSARRKIGDEFKQYSFAATSSPVQLGGDGEAALMLVIGGNLTGSDFTQLPDNRSDPETGVVFDTAATAISGGEGASTMQPISAVNSRGANETPTENRDFAFARRVPRGLPITLVGKTISGSGVTARGFLNIQEEY